MAELINISSVENIEASPHEKILEELIEHDDSTEEEKDDD